MGHIRILGFMEYILILFLILDTNTVYYASFDIDYHIPEFAAVLTVGYILWYLSVFKIKKSTLIRYGKFLLIYYLVMIVLFFLIVSEEKIIAFGARFLVVFPMLVLYFCDLIDKGIEYSPIRKYTNIMTAIAGISLFFWIFASQLHLIKPSGTIRVWWGDVIHGLAFPSYLGLYFEHQKDTFLFYSGYRNQGIFTEGPMFSLCLVLAIAAEIFLLTDQKQKRIILSFGKEGEKTKKYVFNYKLTILVAALITTFTTTGQILLIFMLVFRFMLNRPREQITRIIKLLIWILTVCIGTYAAISIFSMKATTVNWKIRVDDYRAGFLAWMSSPLWGKGYGDLMVINPYKASFRVTGINGGFTNSIMMVLAQGGILLFFIFFLPMYSALKKAVKQQNRGLLLFVLVLLLEFIFTVCAYQFVMLLFIAFLYGIGFFRQNKLCEM